MDVDCSPIMLSEVAFGIVLFITCHSFKETLLEASVIECSLIVQSSFSHLGLDTSIPN